MGWIQEIADLFSKLNFWDIVHEYEQGLYFRAGRVVDRPVKWFGKELDEIIAEEKKVIKDCGGYLPLIFPTLSKNAQKKIPESYKKSFIFGLPKHLKRFERKKVLEPGVYFYIPFLEDIIKDFSQEKVLNLGNICVPSMDNESKEVLVSCNIRYQVLDFYKAYTAVHDYEKSLMDHTLSILAKHSRGKKYDDWKEQKVIEELEEKVVKELRKLVTEAWGLKIHRVYIADHVKSSIQRVLYEGPLVLPQRKINDDRDITPQQSS